MRKTRVIKLLEGKKPFVVSDGFHRATKILSFTEKMGFYYPLLWQKISYKAYPRLKELELSTPMSLDQGLGDMILERRSKRELSGEAISVEELSTLLFYSCGISKNEKGKNWDQALRVYPSAGARFPIETYVLIDKVIGIPHGLYHYNVKGHYLETLLEKQLIDFAARATDQDWILKAAVVFIFTGVFDRTRVKYGERGYNFVLVEAGHICQNLYLVSTALRIKCCAIGGFIEDRVDELLDIQMTNESVIYMAGVGK